MLNFIYIFILGKRLGILWDIQIATDYEMKHKSYYISIFIGLFGYIVGYVYIGYLYMFTIKVVQCRSWLCGGNGFEFYHGQEFLIL